MKLTYFQLLFIVISPALLFFFGVSCSTKEKSIENRTVYIEKVGNNYTLFRNGEPYKIEGAAVDSLFLNELKEAGANTIRVYDTLNIKKILDIADSLGLAVMLDLPIKRCREQCDFYKEKKNREKDVKTLVSVVKKHKDHPALLMWVVGNEVDFPNRINSFGFYKFYNSLIKGVRLADPNHPLTTAISNSSKTQISRIKLWCKDLDAISLNSFGRLHNLQEDLDKVSLIWKGPYIISEWGINGPWEAEKRTAWGAQIEDNSTKKGEQYRDRYHNYVDTDNGRCLGNITFYWGNKQERTQTWYSMFSENGERTQAAWEMEKIWKNSVEKKILPEIEYMLVNKKGAQESLVFNPNEIQQAEILLKNNPEDSLFIKWKILPENWFYQWHDIEKIPDEIEGLILEDKGNTINFKSPNKEGPYRIFGYVYDGNGNYATCNTPFYVLDSQNN